MLVALTWPGLWNKQPFFFPDTTAYIRGADAGVQKATGIATSWSRSAVDNTVGSASGKDRISTRQISSVEDKTVLSGRSVYYGALLYLGDRAGGFWLTIALQAVAVIVALGLILLALRIPTWPWLPIAAAGVGAVTTAPFFVSFLTPDVFASITIVGVAIVLGSQRPMRLPYYGVWLVLLAASLTFHASHVLIAFALLLIAVGVNAIRGSWSNRRGLMLVSLALLAAILAEADFGFIVKRTTGFAPIRPPFIMARLIADGPGYVYLRDTCPDSGFKVCAFVDRLPMPATAFLWESTGVFAAESPDTRRALADEQFRFALSVLLHDPARLAMASVRNAAHQLTAFGLSEFNYGETDKRYYKDKVPPGHLAALEKSAAWQGSFPTAFFSILSKMTLLVALAYIGISVASRSKRKDLPPCLFYVTTLIVAGVVINDVVCGITSGSFDRYGARVVWLIPFSALLLHIGSRSLPGADPRARPIL